MTAGYQGSGSYPEASQAVLVLVLGIIGLVLCQITAPIAWSMGNTELRAIDSGLRPPENRGLANVGRVLGIVGTVLLILGVVAIIAIIGFGIAFTAPAGPS